MESSRKVRAVIFDLGNVLIDFDHLIAARKIVEFTNKTPQELYDLFLNSDITRDFESGSISPQDFFRKVSSMAALSMDYESFVKIWNSIFFLSEKNNRVARIVKILKSRFKLAFLSNINVLHLEYVKTNFASVLEDFDYALSSCEMGFVKPQKEIYQKTLSLLGVSAQEAFYTDDREDLIEGANRLGIQGFVFRSPEQLERDLESAGIKL